MLIDKINKWLSGTQNFIIGRALYNNLGDDENIKALLKKGESPTTKKVLHSALLMLTKQPVIVVEKKVNKITDEMPAAHDDVVLQGLRDQWLPLYQRMNYLRASLDKFGDSNSKEAIEMRSEAAFEILDLEQHCIAIWAKRDHYKTHGALPDVKAKESDVPADPVELAKHIENIKKNIRKNRKKMQQPGADAKYAMLYQQYKNEFKAITGKEYNEIVK